MAVAVVEYKYTPDQMPVDELKRTFAARQELLDLVLRHLRTQTQAASLSSFLLIGPRGSGKTTLVLMLCQCIREDPALAAAWLPLRFREEQFEVCSLRDLLAAAVRGLADDNVPGADAWSSRVEQTTDDEESQSLAVAALRDLARSQGKRLILFVENLNLLMARAFDETSQATLRRLLMVDPFLMLVGTAVQTFEEVEGYDKALFNYFHPLHLERLTDEQMCELLSRRAEYDGNTEFIERLGEHRPKLRALSRVTGGNPRFLLMVYEVLSEGRLTSAVEVLRRLVDDLTPLLKHVLEDLPPQQAKILDALMRAGGTATPAGLAQSTRLKLNVVTAQLRRLKDNRMVEVLGGGKGQTAHYTIPDQLFCTWYQMRYHQRNRRRIELFVEVIRLWFDADERVAHLQRLAGHAPSERQQARSLAEAAEYFAAALCGTPDEDAGKQLMIQLWLRANDVDEAVMALADLALRPEEQREAGVTQAVPDLVAWCRDHGMLQQALETARKVADERPADFSAQITCAFCAREGGQLEILEDQLNRSLALITDSKAGLLLLVLLLVPHIRPRSGHSVIEDGALTLALPGKQEPLRIPGHWVAIAVQWLRAEYTWVIDQCSVLIESGGLGCEASACALACRAFARLKVNDTTGARSDMNESLARYDFLAAGLPLLYTAVLKSAFEVRARRIEVLLMNRVVYTTPKVAWAHLVDGMVEALQLVPPRRQLTFLLEISVLLAGPDTREIYPLVMRRIHERWSADATEGIGFLLPLADVIEGKDRIILDALPPEERTFALDLLGRFEQKDGRT